MEIGGEKINRAILYLKFEDKKLVEIYHSAIHNKKSKEYYVLNPPFESLFRSMTEYYDYVKMQIHIYTNNIDESLKIFTDYIVFAEDKYKTNLEHTFHIADMDSLDASDIIGCLTDFNKKYG